MHYQHNRECKLQTILQRMAVREEALKDEVLTEEQRGAASASVAVGTQSRTRAVQKLWGVSTMFQSIIDLSVN